MFCAIRKFKNKKSSKGNSKRIEVYTSKYENEPTRYCFTFSHEKFERPPRDSYQISIQHSYRENGKVQKKQWKVATINYYEFIDDYVTWKDYIPHEELTELLTELNMTLTQLERMINVKLQPLLNEIIEDWEQSEEYKVTCEMKHTVEKYIQAKTSFEKKWGEETYDYIYDVFGRLRNEDYLDWIQYGSKGKSKSQSDYNDNYKYEKTNERNRSKQERSSNKKNIRTHTYTYSEDEKKWLKKFYRTLAKEFHPDVSGDTEAMVLINKLKNEWDV